MINTSATVEMGIMSTMLRRYNFVIMISNINKDAVNRET